MNYLQLNTLAREVALDDYCDLMKLNKNESDNKQKIESYFYKYNCDLFTDIGMLKHRKR